MGKDENVNLFIKATSQKKKPQIEKQRQILEATKIMRLNKKEDEIECQKNKEKSQ